MKQSKTVLKVSIENYSKISYSWIRAVEFIKKRNYIIQEGISVGGDAPKEFIKDMSMGE